MLRKTFLQMLGITTLGSLLPTALPDGKPVITMGGQPGDIKMWHGEMGGQDGHCPIAADGQPDTTWHVCNGEITNGTQTPDLRDRFIVATGKDYALGNTGGSTIQIHDININSIITKNFSAQFSPGAMWAVTGDHIHNINGHTSPADNRPPYYALVFLCYVGN